MKTTRPQPLTFELPEPDSRTIIVPPILISQFRRAVALDGPNPAETLSGLAMIERNSAQLAIYLERATVNGASVTDSAALVESLETTAGVQMRLAIHAHLSGHDPNTVLDLMRVARMLKKKAFALPEEVSTPSPLSTPSPTTSPSNSIAAPMLPSNSPTETLSPSSAGSANGSCAT